jgi:hypothetical protein
MKTADELRAIAKGKDHDALLKKCIDTASCIAEDGGYTVEYLVELWFDNKCVSEVIDSLEMLGYKTERGESSDAFNGTIKITW